MADDKKQSLFALHISQSSPPFMRTAQRGKGSPELGDGDRMRWTCLYGTESVSVCASESGCPGLNPASTTCWCEAGLGKWQNLSEPNFLQL